MIGMPVKTDLVFSGILTRMAQASGTTRKECYMTLCRLAGYHAGIFFSFLIMGSGWGIGQHPPAATATAPPAGMRLATASGNTAEKASPAAVPPLAADPKTAGMEAYEKNELEKAAKLLREAATLDPNDIEVNRRLGFALKEIGRYEEALAVLERVVAAVPDDYYHWWWLSDAQRLLGRYAESLKSMERSQRLASPDLREELQEFVDYTARLAATDRTWENVAVHVNFAERHRSNRRVRRQIAELVLAYSLCPEVALDNRDGLGRKAHICQQLGIQHMYIEEPEVAVDWFTESARLSEAAGFSGDQMQALKEWAGALWAVARHQPDRAVPLLEQAADRYTAALGLALLIKDIAQERQTRALLLRVQGKLRPLDDPDLKALRERNLKEVPWKGPVNEFSTAEAVMAEAELRAREGDFAGARILLEMAMPYFNESTYLADYHRFTELQLLLSNVWLHLEQPVAALDCVEKARKKAEEARNFIDFDAFNRGQGAILLRHAACAGIRAMAANGNPGDPILTAAEQAFERALYYQMRGLLSDDTPRRDIAGEALAIRARIPLLENRLAEAQARGDAAETERLQQRLARDQERLAWIDGLHEEELVLLQDYRPLPVLGGERFRKMLAPGVAVLHLLSDPYGTVAVLTTAGESTTLECTLTEADAAVLAARIRQGGEEGRKAVADVRSRLVAPLMERLRAYGTTALILCADSRVGQLPLNVLFESTGTEPALLRVTRLPYASQLDVPPRPTSLPRMLAADATARAYPPLSGLLESWTAKGGVLGETPDPEGMWLLAPALNELPPDPLYCRIGVASDGSGSYTTARLFRDKPWKARILLISWVPADERDAVLRSDLPPLLYEAVRVAGGTALLLPDWQAIPETAAAFYMALGGFLGEYALPEAVARARETVRQARPEDWGILAFTCWGTEGIPRPAAEPSEPPEQSPATAEPAAPTETAPESLVQHPEMSGNAAEGVAVSP